MNAAPVPPGVYGVAAADDRLIAALTTLENLQRSANHIADLSRGSLEALAQKIIRQPQPRMMLNRPLGPV